MPEKKRRGRGKGRGEERGEAPRAFWSGTISFGLVAIPVEIYPAVRPGGPSLRLLDEDGVPLRRRYVCPAHGEAVGGEEIVRGYEIDDGRFVVVEDAELERLAPEKSREIDLRRFVALEELDPLYFERAYFLAPAAESTKAYRLLAGTLERTGRAGLGTFVMRGKEHVVAILAEGGLLRAQTLRFPGEVRSAADVGLPEAGKVEGREVKAFAKAIAGLAADELDPEEIEDRRTARLEDLVERKRKAGRGVVEVEAEEELSPKAQVIDLMEVLKRRLEEKEGRGGSDGAPAAGELRQMTKTELYRRASELEIAGRSGMSKEELIEALQVAEAG